MRRVLVTISVQVAAMWITVHLIWDDGDAEHTGHFSLWFPGTANVSNIRVRLIIRLNPDTRDISADLRFQARRDGNHWPDDEPDVV